MPWGENKKELSINLDENSWELLGTTVKELIKEWNGTRNKF